MNAFKNMIFGNFRTTLAGLGVSLLQIVANGGSLHWHDIGPVLFPAVIGILAKDGHLTSVPK